jgi:uncharacterized membrane protein
VKLRAYLVAAGITVIAMLAVSLWAWPQVPDEAQVPIHWGIDGSANGWAPKPVGLLLLPLLTAGIALLLTFAPRLDPRYGNLVRSATAYRAVAYGTLALLAAVHVAATLAVTGRQVPIGGVVGIGVGAFFVVIGNYLGKTRSSWLFGIRTPWTLSSERSWSRTHRLGGYLFVLLGAATIVAGLLGAPALQAVVLLGGMGVVVAMVTVYSYLVWRSDPERRNGSVEQ